MNERRLENLTINRVEIDIQKKKLIVTASAGRGSDQFELSSEILVLSDDLQGLAQVIKKVQEVAHKELCSKLSRLR